MRAIGDVLRYRDPNAKETEIMQHVLEVARAWGAGHVSLSGVRNLCTGYERWTAMRFCDLGSLDKALLIRLCGELVDDHERLVRQRAQARM